MENLRYRLEVDLITTTEDDTSFVDEAAKGAAEILNEALDGMVAFGRFDVDSAKFTLVDAASGLRNEQELYDLVKEKLGFGYDDTTSNFIDAVRAIIKAT